jgi:hypothetical protein
MVCFTQKPNFLAHSCWRVEVVKGAQGALFESFLIESTNLNSISSFLLSVINHFLFSHSFKVVMSSKRVDKTFNTSSWEANFFTFHQILCKVVSNFVFQ